MATLMENQMIRNLTVDKEAELHNAQINERYKRLQNAEADQFAESTEEIRAESAYSVRASVLTPDAPVLENTSVFEQTPQITEFVREEVQSPVFTTEKFESVVENAPVAVQTPVELPIQKVVTAVAKQAEYSLTAMAKVVMATFVAVVVLMLTLICVNTQTLERKSVQLKNLEKQREELVERNEELQLRIEKAQSEETIREYAISQGMIQG